MLIIMPRYWVIDNGEQGGNSNVNRRNPLIKSNHIPIPDNNHILFNKAPIPSRFSLSLGHPITPINYKISEIPKE